ncbi:hypothetical protein [Spiroplasma endosymbiont of Lariophagus distinguendus]|uniref:hypothetical protein n=1 Tax=Spiroplasma endosymbiont of Lariophagus distinguendus TaxID=2935082 RepID=UPI00207A6235|nr:hypothetical protein [Spiroplasma endosymbiont of Lariophagus distinguendus]
MDEMYLHIWVLKCKKILLVNKTLIVGIYGKQPINELEKYWKCKSKIFAVCKKLHFSSKCHVHTDFWKGYYDFKSVFTKHETVNHQDSHTSKLVCH